MGLKNRKSGNVFRYSCPHRDRTAKRTLPSDSAHRIGVSTLSMDVLTADEAPRRWRLKNHKIGHVFHHISTHRARTSKRSSPSDSAHRIGLSTRLNYVLTVEEVVCAWRFINCGILNVFNYWGRTRAHMDKRTSPSDSAHWIGPTPHFKDVLTVDKAVCG